MKTSKTIISNNKDPEAPIFQYSDFGVVGEGFKVIPQLNEELSRRRSKGQLVCSRLHYLIVAELDALQAKVDVLKKLQAETAAELDALLPSILDRAFRGAL